MPWNRNSPFPTSSSSVWGREAEARRFADGLRAGMVCINDAMLNGTVAALPFGGSRESGYGRVHGEEGLREMTQTRSILVDRSGAARELIGGFPFRRFGTRRARALIDLLHGGGAGVRARGLLGLFRNR